MQEKNNKSINPLYVLPIIVIAFIIICGIMYAAWKKRQEEREQAEQRIRDINTEKKVLYREYVKIDDSLAKSIQIKQKSEKRYSTLRNAFAILSLICAIVTILLKLSISEVMCLIGFPIVVLGIVLKGQIFSTKKIIQCILGLIKKLAYGENIHIDNKIIQLNNDKITIEEKIQNADKELTQLHTKIRRPVYNHLKSPKPKFNYNFNNK